jgi:hypothetical protein
MPRLRPCLSCGVLTTQTRCSDCRSTRNRARGSSTQREYDSRYRTERDRVVSEATHCETCGEPFTEDNPATGGHRRDRRHGGGTDDGIMAQCARCNYGWRRSPG